MREATLIAAATLGAAATQGDEIQVEWRVDGKGVGHAAWMLREVLQMPEGSKAHRWLGYAQALLVSGGVLEIEDVVLLTRMMTAFVKENTPAEVGQILEAARLLQDGESRESVVDYLEAIARDLRKEKEDAE